MNKYLKLQLSPKCYEENKVGVYREYALVLWDWEDLPGTKTFEPSVIDRVREGNNSEEMFTKTTTAPNVPREGFWCILRASKESGQSLG